MSFYYWQPVFATDSMETNVLKDNDVRMLYVRYFDVDRADSDSLAQTSSLIRFDQLPSGYAIVPVIRLHNNVFEHLDSAALPALAARVLALVRGINASAHLNTAETQFDCDWTQSTRDNYFNFLRRYGVLSGSVISSTIRLQQLNADHNGVPPVDHGVLIFYNMDNADTPVRNPAYERPVAHRYTPSLRSYPLSLDLALPILRPVTADDLLEMVDDVNRHSNHRIRDLIFFDLDQPNLRRYDKGLFRQVLDRIE